MVFPQYDYSSKVLDKVTYEIYGTSMATKPKVPKKYIVTAKAPKHAILYPVLDEEGIPYFAVDHLGEMELDYVEGVEITTEVARQAIDHDDGMWTFQKVLMAMANKMRSSTEIPVNRWTWECVAK